MPVKKGMYRGERVEKTRSSKLTGSVLVVAFLVVASSWFIFRSEFFDASEIKIDGLRDLGRGEVEREVMNALEESAKWKPWRATNILFVDKEELEASLKDRLFADYVTVDKTYPNILRLSVEERQRSVILASGTQYVLVDTSGVVTGYAEDAVLATARDLIAARSVSDEFSLPVVQMPTDDPLTPGFQVADPETVKLWLDISRSLFSGGVRTHFIKISSSESNLVRVVTEALYELRLDISRPIDDQLEAYRTYLRTTDDPGITEYVDVRVPGKIFVK